MNVNAILTALLIPSMEMGSGTIWPAVTIHNFPEGMAVGVAIAGSLNSGFSMAGALALSLGIAIQNIPEGAIISMPLRGAGNGGGETLKSRYHRFRAWFRADDAGCRNGIIDYYL